VLLVYPAARFRLRAQAGNFIFRRSAAQIGGVRACASAARRGCGPARESLLPARDQAEILFQIATWQDMTEEVHVAYPRDRVAGPKLGNLG
jgi:hypothetical protein